MSKYQKQFISMNGKVFSADVYSVLVAFGVQCPARQHAIKKLLMPGQRGSKSELQDLQEAIVSVSRAAGMARARLPEGGQKKGESAVACNDITLTEIEIDASGRVTVRSGGTLTGEPEVEAEPEPPKVVTLEPCAPVSYIQPAGTVQQLPEEPEPKSRLITWRLCVRIHPGDLLDGGRKPTAWYRSGDIPPHWYPIESYTQPIETVKQFPESQRP